MRVARQHAAARNALAGLLALAALRPAPVGAEGGSGPQLILPLVAAMAAVSAVRGLPLAEAMGGPGGRGRAAFIPSRIQIPDVYANAERDFIDLHRQVEPLDTDRMVWLELFRKPRRGWMPALVYDTEERGPLADTDDVVRVMFEYQF